MRVVLMLTALLLAFNTSAQRSSEVGVLLGATYYSGDLNPTGHFNSNLMHRAAGVLFRRNINSRWSFRLFGLYGKVSGNDALVNNTLSANRSLSFRSNIVEGSGMFELNFFRYVASDNERYFTPTVFAGLGMFWMNPQAQTTDGSTYQDLRLQRTEGQIKEYSRLQPMLPFGVGARLKFSSRLLISLEYGLRKTWTDYLDDVSTTYPGTQGNTTNGLNSPGFQRGNSETKDWYVFSGITATYRFGHKATACWADRVNKSQSKAMNKSARQR